MGDVATLLQAVGGLITAAAGAFVLVWTTVRSSKKERKDAAERAIEKLAVASEDGDITPDELADVLKELRGGEEL
ncbi:hypothetical protein [Lentzea albida]|uniref:Uncharacterized protein n=1 Tax=Lentzea albida TaxID=65499 RepID=A0A1H9VH10_9PSEU|nr:hypothetical protein [Lentzea albida]SES20821.1 hypothetical protein SAMN04488000_118107 [Lentzea albida]